MEFFNIAVEFFDANFHRSIFHIKLAITCYDKNLIAKPQKHHQEITKICQKIV